MPPTKPRQTILVIDDDPTNLKVAVEYLKAYSYKILIARDGETGIERAQLARPDLILLDVQMPGIDGYETCRRLGANPDTAGIPVIFMTALGSADHKLRGFEAGARDYVTKPVEERVLLARARAHLQIRELQLQLEEQRELLSARVLEQRASAARELAHREVDVSERTRLLELVRWQSAQLLDATRQRLDAPGGLARSDGSLVALLRRHLEQARELLQAAAREPRTAEAARGNVVIALELLGSLEQRMLDADARAPTPAPAPGKSPLDGLSEREREIVTLLVQGRSVKEIAYELGVARTTVSTHRKRILDKLGLQDLPSLVKLALVHGVVS
ncbi:MAG: response regulator [Myxococcales bacterium]|nr:response regulator [Myxococcales bacterium]